MQAPTNEESAKEAYQICSDLIHLVVNALIDLCVLCKYLGDFIWCWKERSGSVGLKKPSYN